MASRNASFHEGVLAGVLIGPMKLAVSLAAGIVLSLLLAWGVDWVAVFKVWPTGMNRLREILEADLAQGVALAAMQGGGPGEIVGPANALYGVVFRVTGVHDMGIRFADGAALSIPDTVMRNTYIEHREAIEMAMVGTQVIGVRLATLARFLPLLVLLYVVAAADGLTQRAIRRAGGGRESASLYHRAKHLQVAVLALGGLGVLAWPGSVEWQVTGSVLTGALGLLARGQWAYYKKHL